MVIFFSIPFIIYCQMNRALEACSVFKCMNTHIMGIPGENRTGVERICEEIMAEIFKI